MAEAHCKKFMKLIQRVNTKYFGQDTVDMQQDAMLACELQYEGQDHEKVAEWLFEINEDIEFFGEEVDKFPIYKMVRNIIPQTLKPQA